MIATRQKISGKVLLVLLVCLLIMFDRVFAVGTLRTWLSPVVSTIITTVGAAQNHFSELFVHRATFFSSYQERLHLEQVNQSLEAELAELRFVQQDYLDLQKQLELSASEEGGSELAARVFGQTNTLLIDKGTQQGVQVGNLVFLDGNFVGRVKSAEASFSRLALLGSPEFSVLAQTMSGVVGVVSRHNQTVKVTHIESDQSVEVGESWFTTGDPESHIPRGLLIGKTIETERKVGQATMKVKLDTGHLRSGAMVKIRSSNPS